MFGVAESGSPMNSTNGLTLPPSLADQDENPLVGKYTQRCIYVIWIPVLFGLGHPVCL